MSKSQPVGVSAPFVLSRRAWLARAGLVVAAPGLSVLSACGGGSGDSGGSGSTLSATSYASGAITGFGSIIVNGVRYDDSAARVQDDQGRALGASALQLGVVVEVEGGSVDATGRAKAGRIHCDGGLVGPLEAVDSSGTSLTVLGQHVTLTTDTVLDDSLALDVSTWATGTVLKVHGLYDAATASLIATRIEDDSDADAYRLRGSVSALDASAKTFQIGAALISYASASSVTPTLADGVTVRVELQTVAVGGQWLANVVLAGQRSLEDRAGAKVHGFVSAWTSATAFSVNGLTVDASAATFPDGQAGVVLGAWVEVEGAIRSGVLVASEVSLEDSASDDDHGGPRGHGRRVYELHGTLGSLDTTAQTFVLRGITVSYAGSPLLWQDGLSAATLAEGLALEVRGKLSADRTQLVATRIELED